jgi:hypothetical protein
MTNDFALLIRRPRFGFCTYLHYHSTTQEIGMAFDLDHNLELERQSQFFRSLFTERESW